MPPRCALLISAGPCLTVSGVAWAQTDTQKSAIRNNRRGDHQTYCASITPGGQASFACLTNDLESL
jgi:hypothetical protein